MDQVLQEESEQEERDALAVVSPELLDPELESIEGEMLSAQAASEKKKLDLASFDGPAVLVTASTGRVLSETVIEQLEAAGNARSMDQFVALNPSQVEVELLEELRFTHGFCVRRVGQPDTAYLKRVLRNAAKAEKLSLSAALDMDTIISHVRRLRGFHFDETDLYSLMRRTAQKKHTRSVQTADLLFKPYRSEERRGMELLNGMIGLENVKSALRRQLAVCILETRKGSSTPMCRNMAFSGAPGTGKSVTARLIARILREEGCGSGRFVEAGREQLIGTYLGQTSPKIAKLFRQARGGVLFIDEAGALLSPDGNDSYAVEAVNALVRHMELEPETMVIFATYPEEMQNLLSSNPGLSSRVAQTLEFESYSDDELWQILNKLARDGGYAVPAEAHDCCTAFFRTLRDRKGDCFGNGREARRLFQAAVEELALRTLDVPEEAGQLIPADFHAAAERLLLQERDNTVRRIGFFES